METWKKWETWESVQWWQFELSETGVTWSLGFAACWTPPASGGTMEMITSSLDEYICLILTNTDKYNWKLVWFFGNTIFYLEKYIFKKHLRPTGPHRPQVGQWKGPSQADSIKLSFIIPIFKNKQVFKGLFTYYVSRERGEGGYGKCWPLLTKGSEKFQ